MALDHEQLRNRGRSSNAGYDLCNADASRRLAKVNNVQQAVWSVGGNLSLKNVPTLSALYIGSMARISFTLMMIAIASRMALLLEMIGLYGVVPYSVSQRTWEIGIRIALGAQRENVTGGFVGQGLMLSLGGVAVGLVGAAAATRLMTSVLFNVSPANPITYAIVSLSSWPLPRWRAISLRDARRPSIQCRPCERNNQYRRRFHRHLDLGLAGALSLRIRC